MPTTTHVDYTFDKKAKAWVTKFFPERVQGHPPTCSILLMRKSGEVIAEAGKKITPRAVKALIDEGEVTESCSSHTTRSWGKFVANDIINEETGAIYVEAGDELTQEFDKADELIGGTLKDLVDAGVKNDPSPGHRQHQCWPIHAQHNGGR